MSNDTEVRRERFVSSLDDFVIKPLKKKKKKIEKPRKKKKSDSK